MGSRRVFYDKRNTDKASMASSHNSALDDSHSSSYSPSYSLGPMLFFISLAAASIIRLCLLLSHIRRTFHGFFRFSSEDNRSNQSHVSSSSSSSINKTPYTIGKSTHFRPHPAINPQICPNSSVLIQPNSLVDPIRPNMSSNRSINQDLEANNVRGQWLLMDVISSPNNQSSNSEL